MGTFFCIEEVPRQVKEMKLTELEIIHAFSSQRYAVCQISLQLTLQSGFFNALYILTIKYNLFRNCFKVYLLVQFLWNYVIPVGVFAYCYGRIFHTIRRQSKVVSGHVGRISVVAVATTSRDQNAGQIQQQATGSTTGAKLSRTELNVLQTMVAVIVCFIIFWSVPDISNILYLLGVSAPTVFRKTPPLFTCT